MMAKRKKTLLRVSKSVDVEAVGVDSMSTTLTQIKKKLDDSLTSISPDGLDSPVTPSVSADSLSVDCGTTVESGIVLSPISPPAHIQHTHLDSHTVPVHRKQKATRTQSDIANQNDLISCLDESTNYSLYDDQTLDT